MLRFYTCRWTGNGTKYENRREIVTRKRTKTKCFILFYGKSNVFIVYRNCLLTETKNKIEGIFEKFAANIKTCILIFRILPLLGSTYSLALRLWHYLIGVYLFFGCHSLKCCFLSICGF